MAQVKKDAPISWRKPKQFNSGLEVIENVSTVTIKIAEQMNDDYRRNCAIHDVNDRESRLAADTVYAGF